MTSLVNIQDVSADKYNESIDKLLARSGALSSSKAPECFLSRSLGFDIPLTKKYVAKSYMCHTLVR